MDYVLQVSSESPNEYIQITDYVLQIVKNSKTFIIAKEDKTEKSSKSSHLGTWNQQMLRY